MTKASRVFRYKRMRESVERIADRIIAEMGYLPDDAIPASVVRKMVGAAMLSVVAEAVTTKPEIANG